MSFSGLPSLPSSGLDHGSSVTGVNLIKLFLFVTDSGVGGLSRLIHKCQNRQERLASGVQRLFSSTICDEEKSAIKINYWSQSYKTFLFVIDGGVSMLSGLTHKCQTRLERLASGLQRLFSSTISDEEKSVMSLTSYVSLIKPFYLSLTVGLVASLALPTNFRLGWKDLPVANSSLFSSTNSDNEKKWYDIDYCCQCYKTFLFVTDGGAK